MKRIYNYIFLSVFAFAAAGCLEDDLNPDGQLGNSGDEVQFGLSLNDPSTKTIYGTEYTNESNKNVFPIYWSEGDKVQIASPQCVDGRKNAEYLVTPSTETTGQGYAVAMTKTGDYGVQWGNSATADFYSIYPSNGTSWQTLTEENVVAKLNISSEQSANLVLTPAVTEESKDTEGNTVTTIKIPGWYQAADMKNVIMYAPKTTANRGDVVKLNYKPYSTILEFELGIAQNQDTEGNELPAWGTVKIVSMTLTAPDTSAVVIAGDFSLTFDDTNVPIIEAVGNNSKSIKMDFATQPVLNEENQTLKAKIAMIPLSGVKTLDGWKVTVEVLEGTDATTTTHTKTFTGSKGATALAPGKVHKLKLPKFSQIQAWNPPTNAWIPKLEDYKNIYLTELSLPGAWYSLGKDDNGYQATGSTAEKLWNAGIRAFAVECRAHSPYVVYNGNTNPNRVVASGQGSKHLLGGAYIQRSGTPPYISTIIKNIADQVNPNEFGVLVLSYADGGEGGHRDVDYSYFIKGIQTEIAQSDVSNIFSGEITPETTVSDVLGKLIIKINVDARIPKASYNNEMNALISYNPYIQDVNPLFSKMYWKNWDDGNKNYYSSYNDKDFWWCFSSANRTQINTGTNTTIPTYEERQKALQGMIQHSREISTNAGTNVWFYFNAGGTEAESSSSDTDATDAQNFAKAINPWLHDIIKLKANGGTDTYGIYGTVGAVVESDPSTLGIVMFNQCLGDNTTYHGKDIINEIIHMNNKFTLKRKTGTKAISAAPSYSSGMNDSNVTAFGWD